MKLLLSVTDAAEAMAAVVGGADLIDVKNPREGALGAATPAVMQAVRAAVPPHLQVSAAIGDLHDRPGIATLAAVGAAVAGADLVKVGLGCRTAESAYQLLSEIVRALEIFRPQTRLVACAYGDAHRVGSLPVLELPPVAEAAGCAGAMIDTYHKGPAGSSLLSTVEHATLAAFVHQCHARHLLCGLAGSLRVEDLAGVAGLAPDYVGVRGAACGGDRAGWVTRERVQELVVALNQATRSLPPGVA